MNWFQSFMVRLAARIAPPLNKLLRTIGGTVERAEMEIVQLRERESIRKQRIREEQQELREALEMLGPQWSFSARISAPIGAGASESSAAVAGQLSTAVTLLRESQAPVGVVKCYERLWELELALEDRGWVRELTLSNFEFSLFGIHRIIAICRLYKIKNPVVRRGIQLHGFYVFGRGITISSDDDDTNQILQSFFGNPRNATEVGHCALVQKSEAVWTDGNLYSIFFVDKLTGDLLIRSIDPIEIVEIISDPNDASIERFIHRRWMSQQFDAATGVHQPTSAEAWYPALDYEPEEGEERPDFINTVPVSWDTPVLHAKRGGQHGWQQGVPLAYPAIDYARATKKLIDNWCSMQEAFARFSWQVETQGGLPAIANLKQTFATTLAIGDGTMYEQNPPPTTAAAWMSGPGNKLQASRTAGMIDGPEVGRRVAHMAYMVFGFPETFFADASVGTLATATSLDRPTELMILEEQEWWRQWAQRVAGFAVKSSATAPKGKLREARARKDKPASDIPTIQVIFPSILEHNLIDQVASIQNAMTLGTQGIIGIDERVGVGLLLQELDVEDWQEVLELMYPEKEYAKLMDRNKLVAKDQENTLNPPEAQPGLPGAKPKQIGMKPAEAAKLDRAIASLERAGKLLKERMK